jgi:hypothetical protein
MVEQEPEAGLAEAHPESARLGDDAPDLARALLRAGIRFGAASLRRLALGGLPRPRGADGLVLRVQVRARADVGGCWYLPRHRLGLHAG